MHCCRRARFVLKEAADTELVQAVRAAVNDIGTPTRRSER